MRRARRPRALGIALALALMPLAVGGCASENPAMEPPDGRPADPPDPDASAAGPPATELPAGALRALVPSASEVPAGLVPLPQASGPQDVAGVAAFSADPPSAEQALLGNGFRDAYVAQYAASDARSLSVVVVRFDSDDGARADLEADLAESAGDVVEAPVIGEQSEARRLDLPDRAGEELVTVRFRSGRTTWLLAWSGPAPTDPAVPIALAEALVTRA